MRISEIIDPKTAPENRAALLDHFVTEVSKQSSQKDRFQKQNTAPLCEQLIRQVIADGVPLTKKSIQGYTNLARVAGRNLLAIDLRHIQRDHPKTPASATVAPLPAVSPTQPKWHHIVCLPQRRVLLGDKTGTLRIMRPNGKIEWSDHITDLAGLVRIRTGLFVLLILGQDARHPRRIVMLNTRTCKYTQIGRLNLETWHSESNEHLWLVKSGQRIQALSVAAMFQDMPEFSESWGITITEKIIVLGFIHNDRHIGWYHQRCEGNSGFGLIEYWTASTRTLNFSSYILVPPNQTTKGWVDIYTEPTALRGAIYAFSGENVGKVIHTNLRNYSWDDEKALKSSHFHFLQSLDAPAPIRSYAMGPLVTENAAAIISRICLTRQGPETLICLENCRWIASDAALDGRTWAIIDSDHRVIMIDPVTHEIQIES